MYLTPDAKRAILGAHSLFSGAPVSLIEGLADHTEAVSFGQDEFVYGTAEAAAELFFLVEGMIDHPEVPLVGSAFTAKRVNQAGQPFGFSAALLGHARRVVSAFCEAPTLALRLGGQVLVRTCMTHGRRGCELLERLVTAHLGYECLLRGGREAGIDGLRCDLMSGELVAWLPKRMEGGLCTLLTAAPEIDDRVVIDEMSPNVTVGSRIAAAMDGCADSTSSSRLKGLLEEYGIVEQSDYPVSYLEPVAAAQVRLLELVRRDRSTVRHLPGYRKLAPAACAQVVGFARRLGCAARLSFVRTSDDLLDALAISDVVALENGGGAKPPEQWLVIEPGRNPDGMVEAVLRGAPAENTEDLTTPQMRLAHAHLTERATRRSIPAVRNRLIERLEAGEFFWTAEFIPAHGKSLRRETDRLRALGSFSGQFGPLAALSITDRVHSDWDPDPVSTGQILSKYLRTQPVVHLSGKGRESENLVVQLGRMQEYGLENALFLSGDRLQHEPEQGRARYLESVSAILLARQMLPSLVIAAALNPFKYREEEAMAQYLKMGKKVASGVDYIITQIGFDMRKHEEALDWVRARRYEVPLVANVMPLTARMARAIRRRRIPGITISDSVLAVLESDERCFSDKGEHRTLQRLALQILCLQQLGYAGVQFTGLHDIERLEELNAELQRLVALQPDAEDWAQMWRELWTPVKGGVPADPAPDDDPWYFEHMPCPSDSPGRRRYRRMEGLHRLVFDQGVVSRLVGPILGRISEEGALGRLLVRVERQLKRPTFGCETCGCCRLAATQYVCPETCPKGLANGPCGGTDGNICEFGDRECVHSSKYRIARDAGVLGQLETWVIPAVPAARRGRSSWPAHFRGERPLIEATPHKRRAAKEGR